MEHDNYKLQDDTETHKVCGHGHVTHFDFWGTLLYLERVRLVTSNLVLQIKHNKYQLAHS